MQVKCRCCGAVLIHPSSCGGEEEGGDAEGEGEETEVESREASPLTFHEAWKVRESQRRAGGLEGVRVGVGGGEGSESGSGG